MAQAATVEVSIFHDNISPFALSLSKGFDKLSPNGVMNYGKINKKET